MPRLRQWYSGRSLDLFSLNSTVTLYTALCLLNTLCTGVNELPGNHSNPAVPQSANSWKVFTALYFPNQMARCVFECFIYQNIYLHFHGMIIKECLSFNTASFILAWQFVFAIQMPLVCVVKSYRPAGEMHPVVLPYNKCLRSFYHDVNCFVEPPLT